MKDYDLGCGMSKGQTVFLLYEGDLWLSTSSLGLMGVFTSEDTLKKNAKKLIWERRQEHLQYEKDIHLDGDKIRSMRDICAKILDELIRHNHSDYGYTRYLIKKVELNKLEEVEL